MNSKFKTVAAFIVLIGLVCCRSSATELVLIMEKNRVILAADGLVTDDPEHQSMRRCKIHQSGTDNFFYAVSGPTFDRKVGFDANDLLAKRRKNLPAAAALDQLGAQFLPLLQKELSLIQKESPTRYSEMVQSGNLQSLFVIATFGGAREGYVKDFNIANGRVVATPARNCLGTRGLGAGERCILMSSMKELAPFLVKNPIQKTDDVAATVRKIMDAAENARPNDVGPPISILAIDRTGPQWLEKGLCEGVGTPLKVKK